MPAAELLHVASSLVGSVGKTAVLVEPAAPLVAMSFEVKFHATLSFCCINV